MGVSNKHDLLSFYIQNALPSSENSVDLDQLAPEKTNNQKINNLIYFQGEHEKSSNGQIS